MRKTAVAMMVATAGIASSTVLAPNAEAFPRARYERMTADDVCQRYDSGRVAAMAPGFLGGVDTICVWPHEKDDAGWAQAPGHKLELIVPNPFMSWQIDPANPFSDWEVAVEIHHRY